MQRGRYIHTYIDHTAWVLINMAIKKNLKIAFGLQLLINEKKWIKKTGCMSYEHSKICSSFFKSLKLRVEVKTVIWKMAIQQDLIWGMSALVF